MSEPSKVTKILVNNIHGKRKQDSKFWQSEFSEKDPPTPKKNNFVKTFTLFLLFFIGSGVMGYGGLFLYKKYSTEFTNKEHPTERTIVANKSPKADIDEKPITKKQLDRAIKKAFADRSGEQHNNTHQKANNFYYRVELTNGGKIEAESATRDGNLFTIKDRKGLVFSVDRKSIKNVKKIML